MSAPDRSERVRDLFDEVVELEPEERAARLARACGDDGALRREVESLLEAADGPGWGARQGLEEVRGKGGEASRGASTPGAIPAALQAALADRYAIERELGRGGMATVYLADDLKHPRKVAIKVLNPDLSEALGAERFLREIETASSLTHPHILPLHDSGESDGLLYYVMPYVEGESLRDRLKRERQLPVEDAVRIAREIADALAYAHDRGVVHRDVKPENMLLEADHAVLADFGVAKAVAEVDRAHLTQTGTSLGTPTYMSPEQASGEQALDGRSDQYALGCVLYEMLAGEPPFRGARAEAVVRQHLTVEPNPVTQARPSVPEGVAAALHRALSKNPADRFATARAFAEALANAAGAERRTVSTRRWPLWTATAALVSAIALTWYFGSGRSGGLGLDSGEGPGAASEAAAVDRAWMLPADFGGNADEEYRRIVQELVIVEVDRSPSVVTLTRSEVARGLRAAGRADTATVVPELALELAERGRVGAVLAGEVDRVGNTFSVRVRILDVGQDGRLIAAATSSAEGEDRLISAAGDAARELRSQLGERVADLAGTPSLEFVMTPSLPAYRKFREAQQAGLTEREKIDRLHQALQLDTGFAAAMLGLPARFANIGDFDSAVVYFRRALERSDRLTERQRLSARIGQASIRGDIPEAYRLERELDKRSGVGSSQNLGLFAFRLGRLEDAVEHWSAVPPYVGYIELTVASKISTLLWLGRLEEADSLLRLHPNADLELALLVGRHRWDDALADATTRAHDVTLAPNERSVALQIRAGVLAARGSVRASRQALQDALRLAQGFGSERNTEGQRLVLALASETTVPPLAGTLGGDSSTAGLLFRGVAAAVRGDSAAARELLRRVRQRPPEAYAMYDAAFLMAEAGIARSAGNWSQVTELVAPAATGYWPYLPRGNLRNPQLIQWMVGDAFERMSRPDSAVTYFEMLTTPRFAGPERLGYAYSFAHRRLARLYTRLGDDQTAIEHWQTFLDTFTDPDPEFEWMVDEARTELARLGG